MSISTFERDEHDREEERLEQWLSHPELRGRMDASDPVPLDGWGQSAAAARRPRSGVLTSVIQAFRTMVFWH